MNLPEQIKQQIFAHAQTAEPQEACGFLLREKATQAICYVPCENVADDTLNFFEISPEAYLQAVEKGEIFAVVHSHPNGEAKLSLADRQMQENCQLDFVLVCHGSLQFFPKIRPLVGREFIHGQQDCYSLFRDFYYLAGLDMAEFEREDEWWHKGQNLYLDNLEGQGFRRLSEEESLQIGDVILMQVGVDVPNHAGIYLGNQIVLHHSPKRLSKRDLYDGYWFKHTHSIWRYSQWLQLDFTVPLNNLATHFS